MATYSGTIDLRVTGNAEQKAELIKKRISEIKSIANTLKPVPNLFDKRGNDAIIKAKEELKKLVEQYGKGTGSGNRFSNTIAGLNRQLGGFNRILSNVNIKSDEFTQALTASEKVSRRLARAEAERLKVQTQINTANTVGRATSVQETLDLSKVIPKSIAGLELYSRELQENFRNVEIGSQSYRELRDEILRVNALMRDPVMSAAAPSSPIGGRADIPGSPAALRAGRERRAQRGRDILTGAGFPLLFGGGPAQALAGGIGGAFGGLGGSIAASAIASQVEAFATAAAEAGVALTSTGGALEFVREKSLFSKEANRELAAQLEEQGDAAGLAKLLTEELSLAIGNNGVNALQGLGDTTKETTRLWNLLTTQLFKLISGPLQGFLEIVNQVLGGITGAGSREAFFGDLGSQETAARARFKELTGESLGTGRSGAEKRAEAVAQGRVFLSQKDALTQLRKEFQPEIVANIPVTDQDRRDFSVSGGRAKKGRESRLPQLQAEVALQERLAVLTRQIAKAKADKDPAAQRALEIEVALEKKATAIKKINLEKIPAAEKLEKIKLVELATDEKIFSIEDKLNASKAAQAKKAAETLKGLQSEQNLLQARLDGRLEEEQLEQRINKIMKENEGLTREQVEQRLQGTAALKEQVKALEKLESMYKAIGQSISSGIVDALSAAVEGTKSLADVASQTLRQVANILLQFGVNTALGGIPGLGSFFGGGRAAGGPVSGGTPYMVGEKGPELFVPNTSGNIVPNDKLGGGGGTNVVVNVDAKGSSASGDTAAGKQLGGLIGAAVQAELIKQQRPGGLLTR